MSKQIRVGIIGTSWWADMMFLPTLTSHPRAKIASICGRTLTRAQEMARKYDVPEVYTNYEEMIDQAELEALVVSTPDDLHYPITMLALEKGLHVLCEKPLALNANDAETMYRKAEEKGLKHMVLFTWRWLPHFQHLKRLISDDYIGRCYHCHFKFFTRYGRDGRYAWRFDSQRSNGMLGDLGSHMIDFARLYVGDIVSVSANLTAPVVRNGPEGQPFDQANDAAFVNVSFANGAQGTIQVSAIAHRAEKGSHQHMSFYGEKGTLMIDVNFRGPEAGEIIHGAKDDGSDFQVIPVPDELWAGIDRSNFAKAQITDFFGKNPVGPRLFVDAILEDRPVSPNFYDGFKVQQVVDAALESDRRRCWVSVG